MEFRTISLLVTLLIVAQPLTPRASLAQEPPGRSTDQAADHVVYPFALNEFIEQLGGRRVTLLRARVILVLNPRVFLVETSSRLTALPRHQDRVLVFVERGELRIESELIVESDVRVVGTARTLVGMQMTREVAWPPELTREVLNRHEIRAAVLATSVQTADGVELTSR